MWEKLGNLIWEYIQRRIPEIRSYMVAKVNLILMDTAKDCANSEEFRTLIDNATEVVFEELKLPWYVKPFKSLIKNQVKSSVLRVVENYAKVGK